MVILTRVLTRQMALGRNLRRSRTRNRGNPLISNKILIDFELVVEVLIVSNNLAKERRDVRRDRRNLSTSLLYLY